MNFIYLGSSHPKPITDELLSLGSHVNFAGNTLQEALLEGFKFHLKEFDIITSWGVSTYPKVNKLFFHRKTVDNNPRYIYTGGINILGLNLLSRYIRCRREIKRIIKKHGKSNLIIYEIHTPFLLAAIGMRKYLNHICLIVPDMPQFMSGKTSVLHKFLKRIDSLIIRYCLKSVDTYALLSEGMTELLPMKNKKWVLMEGIFNNTFEIEKPEKEKLKTIMYTGGLYRRRGIDLLINAFLTIKKPDYRLWIRGDGEMKDEIIRISNIDKRIIYFEPMERIQLFRMEQKATVLVNPTQPNDFTNYFFPSKTMEYLASATPTVMFHLGCMPKDYDSYIFYIKGNDAKSLADTLQCVCEKNQEELYKFGKAAREFILKNKTPEIQCKKILDLMNIC